MGKTEVEKALKKLEKASAKDIAEFTNLGVDAIRKALNRMLKGNEVEKIKMTKNQIHQEGIKYSGRHYVWILKN